MVSIIDHVYLSEAVTRRVVDYGVLEVELGSDHRGIRLEIGGPEPAERKAMWFVEQRNFDGLRARLEGFFAEEYPLDLKMLDHMVSVQRRTSVAAKFQKESLLVDRRDW